MAGYSHVVLQELWVSSSNQRLTNLPSNGGHIETLRWCKSLRRNHVDLVASDIGIVCTEPTILE